jgi:hypothetical protein
MKPGVLFAVLGLVLAPVASAQTTTTGKATAKGACSQAVTGNNNRFLIKCSGIGDEQGKKMIEILNTILANQQKLNPDLVMQKLDEILKNVNPNLPVKTYFCNGQWKTAGPSATAGFAIDMGGDVKDLQAMLDLYNTRQFALLGSKCESQIESTPEWLTPRLLCGLVYLNGGDKKKAQQMLDEYEARVGPAYQVDPCNQMEEFLRKGLSH